MFGFALKDPADLASGVWTDLGRITTGAEHLAGIVPSGDCGADGLAAAAAGSKPAAPVCASWRGVISVAPAAAGAWPDILVKAAGTVAAAGKTVAAAPDELYRYDGKGYVLVPAAVTPKA